MTHTTKQKDRLTTWHDLEENSMCFSLKSPLPADKHITYFELTKEESLLLADSIFRQYFDKPEAMETDVFERLMNITKDHYKL